MNSERGCGQKPDASSLDAQLDRLARREQHRQPAARIARRRALLPQHHRRPGAPGVELGRDLGGELARHEAELVAAGVDGDRVGVVRVAGVAPQLERPPRRGRLGRERGGVVAPRARHPRDVQPALGELRRVAGEEGAGVGIDELVPRQPDLAAVLGVPVALGELDVDDYLNDLIFTDRPWLDAYWPLATPVHTRYVPPRRILSRFA